MPLYVFSFFARQRNHEGESEQHDHQGDQEQVRD